MGGFGDFRVPGDFFYFFWALGIQKTQNSKNIGFLGLAANFSIFGPQGRTSVISIFIFYSFFLEILGFGPAANEKFQKRGKSCGNLKNGK